MLQFTVTNKKFLPHAKKEYNIIVPIDQKKTIEKIGLLGVLIEGLSGISKRDFVTLDYEKPVYVKTVLYNNLVQFPLSKTMHIKRYTKETSAAGDYLSASRLDMFASYSNSGSRKQKRKHFRKEINEIKNIAKISDEKVRSSKIDEKFFSYIDADSFYLIKILFSIVGYHKIHKLDSQGTTYLHKAISYKTLDIGIISFLIQQTGGYALSRTNRNGESISSLLSRHGMYPRTIEYLKEVERKQLISESRIYNRWH